LASERGHASSLLRAAPPLYYGTRQEPASSQCFTCTFHFAVRCKSLLFADVAGSGPPIPGLELPASPLSRLVSSAPISPPHYPSQALASLISSNSFKQHQAMAPPVAPLCGLSSQVVPGNVCGAPLQGPPASAFRLGSARSQPLQCHTSTSPVPKCTYAKVRTAPGATAHGSQPGMTSHQAPDLQPSLVCSLQAQPRAGRHLAGQGVTLHAAAEAGAAVPEQAQEAEGKRVQAMTSFRGRRRRSMTSL